jgi:hypothetical protein
MTFTFAEPTELLLEISSSLQAQSWQQSQVYTTASSRWRAYTNQICLNAVLNWIKTEYFPEAIALSSSSLWDIVNGSVISLGEKRILLLPSEAIDHSELEVPQEWVDIPNRAVDYYFAVQVKPDGEWVKVWGYTTHQELKSQGKYDTFDRTYCIDAGFLTKDLNAFFLTYQFCPTEQTKATIAALPELSDIQAENLLQRLGSASVTFPRLAVPFTLWGALLENEQWRQRLSQQRQNNVNARVNLTQWLEGIYSAGWQEIETLFGANASLLALNLRSGISTTDVKIKRAKLIDLKMQIESLSVVLLIALIPLADQQVSVRVQLHPASGESYLPANVKLALFSESGEPLQEVLARRQDNYMQLPIFDVEAGELFSIQVAFGELEVRENFVV